MWKHFLSHEKRMLLVSDTGGNDSEYLVLDSYALLAYLEGEPGNELVTSLLEQARTGNRELLMCCVNFGEVMYIVERESGLPKAQEVLAAIEELPIQVIEADRGLALAAAHIKAQSAIAFADCFAAALAQIKKAELVTGDPEFSKIKDIVAIKWLPGKTGAS